MILIHSGRPSIGYAASFSFSHSFLSLSLPLSVKYAIYSRARHTIGRDLDTIRAVLNSTFRRFGPFFLFRLYAPNPQLE